MWLEDIALAAGGLVIGALMPLLYVVLLYETIFGPFDEDEHERRPRTRCEP